MPCKGKGIVLGKQNLYRMSYSQGMNIINILYHRNKNTHNLTRQYLISQALELKFLEQNTAQNSNLALEMKVQQKSARHES